MSDAELAAWIAADHDRIIALLNERDAERDRCLAAEARADAERERAEALRAALEELTDAAGLIVNGYARKVHPGREARDYGYIGEALHQRTMQAIAEGGSTLDADDQRRTAPAGDA